MSTAPKLTYAKIGNKARNKVEADSRQLFHAQGEQQSDLFAHLNQDNLNYISKQLKSMKMNVSRQQTARQNDKSSRVQNVTNLDRLYNKYKGEERISEKEPDLEETDRLTTQEKDKENRQNLAYEFNTQVREDFKQIIINRNPDPQYRQLSNSQIPANQTHSRVYSQNNKKANSLQAYFGVRPWDQNGGVPRFLNGLDDYLSDLTQSKSLKVKPSQESSPTRQQQKDQFMKASSRRTSKSKKHSTQIQSQLKQSQIKLHNLKKSNTSFAERKNKQLIMQAESFGHASFAQQSILLAQQKRNTLQLAMQLQKIRKFLLSKDNTIKTLELNNELLREEVTHLQINQEIIFKKQYPDMHKARSYRPHVSQKSTRRMDNQSQSKNLPPTNFQFVRMNGPSITNPTHHMDTSRENSHKLHKEDLYVQVQPIPKQLSQIKRVRKSSGRNTPRMKSESLQKIQQEFQLFLKDEDDRVSSKKGSSKLRENYY